jgi:TPR repeat protein
MESARAYPKNIRKLMTKRGIGDAAWELYQHFQHGTGGVEPNEHEAERWFLKARRWGHLDAGQWRWRDSFRNAFGNSEFEVPENIGTLMEKAMNGCGASALELAVHFSHGTGGVKRDVGASEYWFDEAKELGHPAAQDKKKSSMYDLSKYPDEIGALMTKALDGDCGESAWKLALHFRDGTGGVVADKKEWNWWGYKSADLEYPPAVMAVAKSNFERGLDGDEPQREFKMKLAIESFKKIVALDVPETAEAAFGLFRCYYDGVGVEQDKQKSVEMLRLAAEKGDPEAQSVLAHYHITGAGVDRDCVKAEHLALKAAAAGCDDAVKYVKDIRSARAGLLDLVIKFSGLRLSSEARVAHVFGPPPEHRAICFQHNLALCFLHGVCGLEKNLRLAKDLLKRTLAIKDPRVNLAEEDVAEVKAHLKQLRRCSGCGKYAHWTCKLCRGERYCSRKCQKWHWKHGDGEPHKVHCPRVVTTIPEEILFA